MAARSFNQKQYIRSIATNDITLAIGPAGSGKTHIAVGMAVQKMRHHEIERIIVTRPAVEAGASIGFLPGTMEEKVGPYLVPLFDEFSFYIERKLLTAWLAEKVIEIVPLTMMRGRTFNNAFVILDEAQNATLGELRMFLTRIGLNSKMVLTGDLSQSDLPPHSAGAFEDIVNRLEDMPGVGIASLDDQDIVRHRLIADIQHRLA